MKQQSTRFGFTLLVSAVLFSMAGCIQGSSQQGAPGIDFTMAASPGSQTVVAGNGASFKVAVTPAAMIGQVSLGVTGLPPGADAAFTPGFDGTGSRTLNVFTTTTTPPASAQLTITATGPSGTRSAKVSLSITPAADFTLAVTPANQTVKPGGSVNYTVAVTMNSGTAGPVTLKAVGTPPTATAIFDRNVLTTSGTATLTLTASPDIVTVIAPMDVVASDTSGTISAPFGFAIIPADFYLSESVSPVEVNAGGTITGQINIVGLFATPGTVSLGATGLPSGVTATLNPGVVTGEGITIISIATDTALTPGDYSLTVEGVDASGRNLVKIPFTVVPGNPAAGFFLSASPISELITAGQGAFFNINVSAPGGVIPPLTFQVSGLPSGVDANVFSTGKGPGSFGLSISTSPFVTTGAFSPTITATGPNGSQSLIVTVFVKPAPL